MTYITKKDRETIRLIENCINKVTGYDKDYYLNTKTLKHKDRVLRYAWIYEIYTRTLLHQQEMSELGGIIQSNISKGCTIAKKWMSKGETKYQKQLIEIHNEIERAILERGNS